MKDEKPKFDTETDAAPGTAKPAAAAPVDAAAAQVAAIHEEVRRQARVDTRFDSTRFRRKVKP